MVEEDVFSICTPLDACLDKVWKVIVQSNPGKQLEDIRLLIHRSPIPHAACYGKGSTALNLGLLRRLQNESQLAFVLAPAEAYTHIIEGLKPYLNESQVAHLASI